MNRFYQIRRMRGAAFLILVGVLALLNQWHVLRWDQSWPLFLILAGLLILIERAAWMADARDQQTAQTFGATYPAPPNPYSGNVGSGAGAPSAAPDNTTREER